ncbi:immunoglobulin-like domain-containing protein [Alkaliphilus serpentinus]|uniref:Bacterial Ig-like domain-containing protein n=1 Tax=Alkaliphilus serpentinus TaxID=1482731 RepID=A0A833M7B9_9FIRM|nr:immunoglobulin-like domain-containing protein [Alkaliphilus serpentinus]KAB3527293.1 hypothetical protein F8153_12585 [Alkaliphilus serpentinus]
MKRKLYLLVCMVITMTLLFGCRGYNNRNSDEGTGNTVQHDDIDWEFTTYENVNDFVGVTMIVKEETVLPTGLTVIFENNSDNRCTYGDYFLLEKKINEKWYQVPVAIEGEYGFHDIGYELVSGDSGEWKVNWDWLYGSLNTGEYRIIKDILDIRGTGDYDKYYMAAEFTID